MQDALGYPLRGEVPARTLATGALLSALGVLIIPGVFVAGYYGRVLAGSAAGDRRPPEFVRWRALFVQGMKTWAVVAAYLALAFGLAVLLGVASIALGDLGTGAGAAVGLLAWVVAGLTVLGFAFGPAWFFLPAVLTRVARADDVGAAFEVRPICRLAVRREYLVGWLAGAAVLLVGSVAYGIAGAPGALSSAVVGNPAAPLAAAVGLLGHAVGATVNFYCQVTAFHLFGRGYGAAGEAGRAASADEEPAEAVDDGSTEEPRYTGWGAEAREWRARRREEREHA